MTAAIDVLHVSFGYTKNEPVLKNVSFRIDQGDFVAIIGPNGGGKTTLLKLLMGFLLPWKGHISLFGKKPTDYPNGIAYVPQALHSDRQFPISVIDLVLGGRLSKLPWWGSFSKGDREAAMQALEQVKLVDYYNRPFGTLSGGQAQRALIARALAQKPEILLLDEPMSYVDAEAEADIYDIFNQIQGKITCLMVTHDIRTVIQKVKRVLCMQGTATSLEPSQICEHFALGLYHFPLQLTAEAHLKPKTVFIK
jgi:zinc transport system ATP-binding protein